MEDSISYPLPQLQATEAWEGGCLLSLPCVLQMCIFRGVLCLVPAVGIYVCVNPFPMPCMTCDAADTTILCAGVLGGTEGHVPVLLHPPPCDPCTRL